MMPLPASNAFAFPNPLRPTRNCNPPRARQSPRRPLRVPSARTYASTFAATAATAAAAALIFTSTFGPNAPSSAAASSPASRSASLPIVERGHAHVIDGDTLVLSGRRVRLKAMDAPELVQTCIPHEHKSYPSGSTSSPPDAACGIAARDELQRLVDLAGGVIECRGKNEDRYGRLVAYCSSNGHDLGAALVRQGFALAYPQYGRDYVDLEDEAKINHR